MLSDYLMSLSEETTIMVAIWKLKFIEYFTAICSHFGLSQGFIDLAGGHWLIPALSES